jgi:hypothetical protein
MQVTTELLPANCAVTAKNIVRILRGDEKWASIYLDQLYILNTPGVPLYVEVFKKKGSGEPVYSSFVHHRRMHLSTSPVKRKLRASYDKVVGHPTVSAPARMPVPLKCKECFKTHKLAVEDSTLPIFDHGLLHIQPHTVIDAQGMAQYVMFSVIINGKTSENYFAILYARCSPGADESMRDITV